MRIAILTTENREHDKDYAAPVPRFGTAPAALLQGFEGIPEAEIHVVCCVQKPVAAPKKIAPNIFYHSLVVPRYGWMRTGYQGCIRAVRKKLREIRPHIVHGQGTERDCAMAAVFSGFSNVLTLHGNMRLVAQVNHARPLSFLWAAAKLEGLVLPRTQGVVCITHYTQKAVADLAARTWVLPNAVDAGFFEVEAKPDPAGPPVGICVGAVCHRKNQNDFIRALAPLAREKKFEMIFLGQVEQDDYGREFLDLVQQHSWCEYAGFAGRERIKEFFRSATFLALPTREDNCPMVVLEAMASGVPVLASEVGGIPDLIEPGVTGWFGDPLRPETFATGIKQLLEDPAGARQVAVAARQRARERFHPAIIARRHLEIYGEVLGKS